ncbi:CidA/LrgA family protein [Aestuariicoccus sp. MJ-SS9]|uniref:CidA/LrgA family protein n=1 Tax=Aestuariicoccus sp. MJ-SS9 TaxID=3079855 RepID=UPI0029142694|nr:CidA/LrgA family protein [Aestuariicoccus sp. MJ-SS9]MDU8914020.1 CidA/LrgA family protein [Aestuariicoccus sp. MJ-SS9]
MIRSAAIVLALLVIGDAVAAFYALPIPGAALGLAALTLAFALRGGPDPGSEELFDFAAPYFPLFFVPAAVGLIGSIDIISHAWISILGAIAVGTALTLVITGQVFQALMRRVSGRAKA